MRFAAFVLAALVAVGIVLVLYASPAAPPAEMTEAEIARIEANVKAVADDWRMGFLAERDVEEYVNTESDWADGAWSADRSKDAARAKYRERWPARDTELVDQLDTEVGVLAPNVATVRQTYRFVRTDTAGVVLVIDVEEYHVWVLEDAGWEVLLAKRVDTLVEEG
jgi:hypothetical protein